LFAVRCPDNDSPTAASSRDHLKAMRRSLGPGKIADLTKRDWTR